MAARKSTRRPAPPELPELHRRLRFGGWQMVGLALIMVIPMLAAFRVFGEGSTVVADRGASMSLSVQFPSRVRHGTLEAITVELANYGPSPLDTVTVRFDTSYVGRFTDPQFVPSAARVYEVELTDVGPGESRRVQLGVRANEYGRHRGIVAAAHSSDSARVAVSTFVLP